MYSTVAIFNPKVESLGIHKLFKGNEFRLSGLGSCLASCEVFYLVSSWVLHYMSIELKQYRAVVGACDLI